jgi:hypothetical protein
VSDTVEEQLVRSLTDEQLCDRLITLGISLRAFTPSFRTALISETVRRLASR